MRTPADILALILTAAVATAGPAHARDHAARHHLRHGARVQVGRASYFSPKIAGRKTASGRREHVNRLTAASRTLPLGTKAKVTDVKTGRSVKVTVTDRGPFVRRRILDVSPKAAAELGMKHDGVALVKVKPLHEPRRG